MTISVGILASESSWHFQDLKRANNLSAGRIRLRSIDFTTLASSVGNGKERFSDRGSSIDDLDALIVRTMPRGSLQQIVFRMDVLHRLAASGVYVVNSPRSVEIAIDKYLSLSLMASDGISVPDFAVCQTIDQGLDAFDKLGGDVVLKPVFGSMGKNLRRLRDSAEAKSAMKTFVENGEILYLQKFVHHGGQDIRILVVGEKTFSMKRVNPKGGWLTNISRGAEAKTHIATQQEIELATMAANSNACQIAGVDIAYGENSADPIVLEVNASPGWEAIQKVCEGDVANSVLSLITTNLG